MSKSWTSPPHAVNLRQFFDNIYNLRLLRNFPVTSRRRSCSRYRKIFPAWKNVKYQYGQGAKCSSTNTGVFNSQACTFPEESFILSSPCNSVCRCRINFYPAFFWLSDQYIENTSSHQMPMPAASASMTMPGCDNRNVNSCRTQHCV
jgi:hypothetical protein